MLTRKKLIQKMPREASDKEISEQVASSSSESSSESGSGSSSSDKSAVTVVQQ